MPNYDVIKRKNEFLVDQLRPLENVVNVRSSGEEMMANMQSLLDVEDSINVSYDFLKIFNFFSRLTILKMMSILRSRRIK